VSEPTDELPRLYQADELIERVEAVEREMLRQRSVVDEAVTRSINACEFTGRIYRLMNRSAVGGRAVRSVAFLAGLGGVGAGCWALSPPLAGIVLGTILACLSIFGTIRGTKEKTK
jgi:hypothetical protein